MNTHTVILPMSTKPCDNVTACKLLVRRNVIPQNAPITSNAATVSQLRLPTENTPHRSGCAKAKSRVVYARLSPLDHLAVSDPSSPRQ